MESSEGPPVEEKEEEEHIPEEKDDIIEKGKFQSRQDFLNEFKEKDSEYMQQDDIEDLSTKSIDSLKLRTIRVLEEIRNEEYNTLYNKYKDDEKEIDKIVSNRNKYIQYDSENEDVRIFLDISKNIDLLEKDIFTEDGIQAMHIFDEEEPRAKKLRDKLIEFFKNHRNIYLFSIGGTFVIALSGVVVAIEEILKNLKNEVEKKMYKKYLEDKDEIKKNVEKKIKESIDRSRDNIKKDVIIVTQKKVEYMLLNLVDDILHKVLKYLFGILVSAIVIFLTYYKYG